MNPMYFPLHRIPLSSEMPSKVNVYLLNASIEKLSNLKKTVQSFLLFSFHFIPNIDYKSSASSSRITSRTLRFGGAAAVGGGGAGGISAMRFNR